MRWQSDIPRLKSARHKEKPKRKSYSGRFLDIESHRFFRESGVSPTEARVTADNHLGFNKLVIETNSLKFTTRKWEILISFTQSTKAYFKQSSRRWCTFEKEQKKKQRTHAWRGESYRSGLSLSLLVFTVHRSRFDRNEMALDQPPTTSHYDIHQPFKRYANQPINNLTSFHSAQVCALSISEKKEEILGYWSKASVCLGVVHPGRVSIKI